MRHLVTYLSEGITETECNYEIYDRELLAVIRALESWNHCLEGLSEKFPIYTDHKNLEYWKTVWNLTRWQARWSLFLSRFNFEIVSHAGKTMGKPNALSISKQHKVKDEDDNYDQVVLGSDGFRVLASLWGHTQAGTDNDLLQRIRTCSEKNAEVTEALAKVQELEPRLLKKGLKEWNTENGLLLFWRTVYVPNNSSLRKELVRWHHDVLAARYPGRAKTLELLSRNYWWPEMTKFVNEYVDTCDTCQRTKVFPQKPRGLLQPLDPPESPWKSVSTDFVVKLPISEGYDSIMIVIDCHFRQVHCVPTRETMATDEHIQEYIREVFRHHRCPKQMISDQESVFVSKFLKAIYSAIDITSSMSTAYHSQTDGKTEHTNQEIEQYLRTYCSFRQDSWVKWLPMAKFALNSRVHLSTGRAHFELIYRYISEFQVSAKPTGVPAADERLHRLREAQEDARAALKLIAEWMKRFYNHGVSKVLMFKVGDKVYLEREQHPKGQPFSKLAPQHDDPYTVLEKLSELNYWLKLTAKDMCHPVFHIDCLHPAKTAQLVPDHDHPEPTLIVVDEEEEYNVEAILDFCLFRNRFQYLVQWKGYSAAENSWDW